MSIPAHINQAANHLVNQWLGLSEDSFHTPTDSDRARAGKLRQMLVNRMLEVEAEGGNPTSMTRMELLPDVDPDKIELSEADYD